MASGAAPPVLLCYLPMSRRFVATLDTPLRDEGFPTFEARVAGTDANQIVKGMFFEDIVKILGEGRTAHDGELLAPPKSGRYLPFTQYPLRDHAVLAYHAARKLHPELSMREGVRRLHRGNIQAFARTTVGKVITALAGDIKSGFAHLEDAYRLSRVSGVVTVKSIEERAIEVRFEKANPWLDCADLGSLEGMGSFFGKSLRTEVALDGDDGSFVCRWRE